MLLPKRLVFTGGGTRCIVFVEALIVLEEAGVLERVSEYWGTSAGAFLAAIAAIADSMTVVRQCLYDTDYIKFRDIDVNNLLNINKSWGLDNGNSLMDEISRILEILRPGCSKFTMADVPSLTIVISDLSTQQLILCNAANYPRMPIVEAIRASMSLPLFFRPYIHKESGHIWVDGAVGANFPWNLLPTDTDRYESLGFTFEQGEIKTPVTFSEYMFSMVHFRGSKEKERLKEKYSKNIIWFPNLPFPSWFMRIQPADFEMLRQIGSEAARGWLTLIDAERSCLQCLQGKNGNSLPCEVHCNRLPSYLQDRKEGMLDNQKSSNPEQLRDSSQLQSPCIQPSDRRWSW